jgi:hypothetical protein
LLILINPSGATILICTVKDIYGRTIKKTGIGVNFCQFLKLRKANGQKKEREQNLEDGEKSAPMPSSLGKERIQPLNML